MTLRVALTRGDSRENFHTFVDAIYSIDMEPPVFYGFDNVRPEHQIAQIRLGHQHALISRNSLESTDIIETFDLVVDTANGLDLAVLIHRARDSDTLLDRKSRKTGKSSVQFRGGGAVAIHAIIGLFEANTGGEGQLPFLSVLGADIAA